MWDFPILRQNLRLHTVSMLPDGQQNLIIMKSAYFPQTWCQLGVEAIYQWIDCDPYFIAQSKCYIDFSMEKSVTDKKKIPASLNLIPTVPVIYSRL